MFISLFVYTVWNNIVVVLVCLQCAYLVAVSLWIQSRTNYLYKYGNLMSILKNKRIGITKKLS